MKDNTKKKLPEGWRWVFLGELCNITNGTTNEQLNIETSFPVTRIETISKGIVDFKKVGYTILNNVEQEKYRLKKYDILLSHINSFERIGHLAIYLDENITLYHGMNLLKISAYQNIIYPFYLFYSLKSPNSLQFYKDKAQRAINQASLNQTTLKKLPIPLPPILDDQIRIANELERKMNEVENMRQVAKRRKEAISAMQGAILREVFPYKEGDKLPEGWRWETLENFFTIDNQQIDISNPSFYTLPFIGMDNIESNTRKFIPNENTERGDSSCFLFDVKHVLYGKLRPYLNKVHLPDKPGRCSMELLPLIPKNGFTREFIASVLQSEIVISYAVKHSKGGRMPRANMDKLMKLRVAIPSNLNVRICIANELERKMAEVEKMWQEAEKELEAIEALPGAILREVFDFESS